jgi:hypothetical protein
MGEETAAAEWVLRARVPRPARLRVLRDGEPVAESRGEEVEHWTDAPGVYRVEAYREAHGRERTWILTNPIYLR